MEKARLKLDYAKPPRWYRRRALQRLFVGAALALTVVATCRFGPEKWERAKLLYWQWRCMHYTAPADEIVFDRAPSGKSELLDGRPGYTARQTYYSYSGSPLTEALKIPKCKTNFIALAKVRDGFSESEPILFMHERTSPSGYRYLIILRGADILERTLNIGQLSAYADSFKPGDWHHLPEPTDAGHRRDDIFPLWPEAPKRIRIYAGQVDDENPAHFTIRYEQEGLTRRVDGFVSDAPFDEVLEPGVRQVQVRLVEREKQ